MPPAHKLLHTLAWPNFLQDGSQGPVLDDFVHLVQKTPDITTDQSCCCLLVGSDTGKITYKEIIGALLKAERWFWVLPNVFQTLWWQDDNLIREMLYLVWSVGIL